MPGPVARPADAGLEEGANGGNVEVFPPIYHAEDGRPSNGDVAGAGDPARERPKCRGHRTWSWSQCDADKERRERGRGTGGFTRAMGVGSRRYGERCGVGEGGGR